MMEIVGAPIELKREFKNKKSNRLNKEYRIVGYKISNAKLDASNGEIKLVKVYSKSKNNIDERINELEHKIKILTDSLTQIIDLVNSNANSS